MKGLMIFSNGMEDNEALSTVALLRRAGIQVDSATMEKNRLVQTSYGQNVIADWSLDHVDFNEYDFLLIPGGRYVASVIDKDVKIKETIMKFYEAKKLIGAICAGPRFLGQLGLLDHLQYTAFPGSEKDAPKGLYMANQKAVTTDQIITARSAGAVIDFVYALVSKLKGEQAAKQLLEQIIY
jgi:4-methyl-5(b-hydroxyethyl)-thiazole monophosphate biosynthesis